MADGSKQPRCEGVVGFEADEVGSDFGHVIVQITGVKAAVVGLVLVKHREQFLAGSAIDDAVGGESGIAFRGKENFPEGAGLFGGGGHGEEMQI